MGREGKMFHSGYDLEFGGGPCDLDIENVSSCRGGRHTVVPFYACIGCQYGLVGLQGGQ